MADLFFNGLFSFGLLIHTSARRPSLLILLTCVAATAGAADEPAIGTPRLVVDFNPDVTFSSSPEALFRVGNAVYFTADDGVHGRELWRSDGTAQGTAMVLDIEPGRSTASVREMTDMGGQLYFSANSQTGQELWTTDGTDAGTRRVAGRDQGVRAVAPRTWYGNDLV